MHKYNFYDFISSILSLTLVSIIWMKFFEFTPHWEIDAIGIDTLRNYFAKLKNLFRKTNMGQKKFLILVSLYVTGFLTQLKKRLV